MVVANAGMTTTARAWEIPLENWDVTIGICLTGAYYTARAAIPVMIEQGTGGAIVFTSSVAGLVGLPLLADYVAAKHGVTGLANELGQYRIRVNSFTRSELTPDSNPACGNCSTATLGSDRCTRVRCPTRSASPRTSPPPSPGSPRTRPGTSPASSFLSTWAWTNR